MIVEIKADEPNTWEKSQQNRRSPQGGVGDRPRKRFSDLAKLHLDSLKDVLVMVLLIGDNDLRARETAQQTFVMMWRIYRDVAAMMQACLALVAVD